MRELVIGSRGSPLALRQSQYVRNEIEKHNCHLRVRVETIPTSGDQVSQWTSAQVESSKGLFVKEIEEALLEGTIDLAVHSLKDLPLLLPAGLVLAAIPKREDARDCLVAQSKLSSLADLPRGARLGTGSLRRKIQLQSLRPDIEVVPVRGNVGTRIRKLSHQALDAVVLAVAGLKRLSLEDQIDYIFPAEEMIPALGQGTLALEARSQDEAVLDLITALDDPHSRCCTQAERSFLGKLGGGCRLPMGGYASLQEKEGTFSAFVGDLSCNRIIRAVCRGPIEALDDLALEAADDLLCQGADAILRALFLEPQP